VDDCPPEQEGGEISRFYLSPQKKLVVPEVLIDECIYMMVRVKKLPLSIAGRMTVLSSYIQLKLLYQLTFHHVP